MFEMVRYMCQHEHEREWAMDKQVAVAFDIAGILGVEVNSMGVECESRETEEK